MKRWVLSPVAIVVQFTDAEFEFNQAEVVL